MGIDGSELKRRKTDRGSFPHNNTSGDREASPSANPDQNAGEKRKPGIVSRTFTAFAKVCTGVLLFFVGIGLMANFADYMHGRSRLQERNNASTNSNTDSNTGKYISAEEYGTDWPFTIQSGTLNCISNNIQGYKKHYVSISQNGNTWAVNGSAMGVGTYRPLEEIWKNNPDSPGAKIPVGDIIKRGLALCNNN